MRNFLADYFRCSADLFNFRLAGRLSQDQGFVRFGPDIVFYGHCVTGYRSPAPSDRLYDVSADITRAGNVVELPFDPSEVVTNFYYERYTDGFHNKKATDRLMHNAYYYLRPLLPVSVRKYLQKARLNGWKKLSFPRWPVDCTVDELAASLMGLAVKTCRNAEIPFIWFWPEGKDGCAILTHDVETQLGVDLTPWLMDTNASFGVPASFQIVPEERYPVSEKYLENIRSRGFEVNVQDLNHDGHLYRNRCVFERRAEKINHYRKLYRAAGFRAGVLYRNQDWYELLDFDYDTSIPNVAHLDPQRGGCCTVMPYFIGDLVELPVTTTQDYSLFHILNDYSLQLWKHQMEIILQRHGLINVITHPDYITGPSERKTYGGLLNLVDRLRRERNVWVALPKEVSRWWRQRSQMQLIKNGDQWHVTGEGSERAVVAYATLDGDTLRHEKALAASIATTGARVEVQ